MHDFILVRFCEISVMLRTACTVTIFLLKLIVMSIYVYPTYEIETPNQSHWINSMIQNIIYSDLPPSKSQVMPLQTCFTFLATQLYMHVTYDKMSRQRVIKLYNYELDAVRFQASSCKGHTDELITLIFNRIRDVHNRRGYGM